MTPIPVVLPDGTSVVATEAGKLCLGDGIYIHHVLCVPKLQCTLISVSKLAKELNCFVTFTDAVCVIQDRDSRILIGAGEQRDGVYLFRAQSRAYSRAQAGSARGLDGKELWHRRPGHPGKKLLSFLPVVTSSSNKEGENPCNICLRAKQTREVFPLSNNKAAACFDLIHVDLWGAYRTPSTCGAVYFLTIVDDFSRVVWVNLLLEKTEVEQKVKDFCAMVTRQFQKSVKVVRSDNGTEFICLKKFFTEQGIIHQTSCIATPQQNGRVERKHRHILNVARALLFQASLPIRFWGESVMTSSYLINRTPSMLHGGKTPFELLYGHAPRYDELRIFGCLCFAHRVDRSKDKFKERSRKCVFLGYPYGKKGWRVYDVETGDIFISRDVIFSEAVYPYKDLRSEDTQHVFGHHDDDVADEGAMEDRGSRDAVSGSVEDGIVAPIVNPTPFDSVPDYTNDSVDGGDNSEQNEVIPDQVVQTSSEVLGRGHRERKSSVLLKDFVTYSACAHGSIDPPYSAHTPPVESSGTSLYPLAHYLTCDKFSARHRAFVGHIDAEVEPTTFGEAMKEKKWRDAMKAELKALEDNETWTSSTR
ncbi:hypothetical protein CASFOL_007983 [Castilleja foliolosa]|uniref:Integrase catalytic domain-containing protein n=1 Tax=Castilleja foliolosa TaxID=1961234 RepID=A0ABD3DXP3_9LAMI